VISLRDREREAWPIDGYLAAWKTYRRLANENVVTASHLVARGRWPKKEGLHLCDIGCGDGRLMESVLMASPSWVEEVRLVDPESELLAEAVASVTETNLVRSVRAYLGPAEELLPQAADGCDGLLLVHVAYLLPRQHFVSLLRSLPMDVPCFIVLDSKASVFTSLWKHTSPKYYRRSLAAHAAIEGLPRSDFEVQRSSFRARLPDPRSLTRPDLLGAVLSILCYAEFSRLEREGKLEQIYGVLDKFCEGAHITCESVCYELIRR